MKFGLRTPSLKRSLKARTTGRAKRAVKIALIPGYGKKGMGYVNNPKKAFYNKIYNKTTVGIRDVVNSSSPNAYDTNFEIYEDETNISYSTPIIDIQKYPYSAKMYNATRIFLIIISWFLIFVSCFIMPIGLLFIALSLIFLAVAKTYKKVVKLKKCNETNLPLLSEQYIDEQNEIWETYYKYEYIDIELIRKDFSDFKANQTVDFIISNEKCNLDDKTSIQVLLNDKLIGYINAKGQRQMIFDYLQKDEYMVQAQFSFISDEHTYLRIFYYQLKRHREQKALEAKMKYEEEKASYKRLPPVEFETTLVYNGNDSMQYSISLAKIGDELDFEQDDEDRYLVSNGALDFGYLPKRISDKIQVLADDGYEITKGKIIEILDNSDRLNIKIHLTVEDTNYL